MTHHWIRKIALSASASDYLREASNNGLDAATSPFPQLEVASIRSLAESMGRVSRLNEVVKVGAGESPVAKLLQEVRALLSAPPPADPNLPLTLLDAIAAYRLLLGRNPSAGAEMQDLQWLSETATLGEFLTNLKNSAEFRQRIGIIAPGQILMAELADFRFWFNTSDVEMGLKMGFGTYEPETVNLMKELVKPGMTCWDVGAQTGFYTCVMSHLVGEKGRVIAYEPMPASFSLVEKNIRENNFGDRASAFNAACSDKAGQITMQLISGMFITGADVREAEAHQVRCVPLDAENLPAPDLIKIDVEGHEPAVLTGMEGTLAKHGPMLVMELNEYWLQTCSGVSGRSVLERLAGLGYTSFDLEQGTPIDPSTFSQQMGDNRNILARR